MLAAETKAAQGSPPAAAGVNLSHAWKTLSAPVGPFLEEVSTRLTAQVAAFDPEIAAYAAEALQSQGKQLRPVLVGLSGRSLGELTEAHVTVAVIIEMVHLATLVHDDVLDEAQVRRGQPTLAAHWGNDISVLVGDCLFAHALQLAASFPTTEVCRAVSASTNTVCAGEILQTRQRRNFNFSQQEYFKVVGMKTGELFALSCDMGAYLSRAKPAQREALRAFGMALGTAYQVYDDCVDLFASEAEARKSLGTDLAKGKLTLPVLLLLERLEPAQRQKVQEWIEHWHPARLRDLLHIMARHEALEGAVAAIQQRLGEARQHLRMVPATPSRQGLEGLADLLGRQAEALRNTE
ncbi:MAG: polyprenyl synthetase family protein [Verrucomicrobiae bacterium]|nr:polyprenyl synthetase family protein [Verrucomicrobiae bacterium]